MKSYLLIFLVILTITSCSSKQESIESTKIDSLISRIQSIGSVTDSLQRAVNLTALWDSLLQHQLIPLTDDSTVLFLYRGEAELVTWNGDFNSWSSDASFRNIGTNIDGTDIWFLKQNFPSDARLDYKVTINGENWILDPANPFQQWSGFGPNSELRMPNWKEELLTKGIEGALKGSLSSHKFIESKFLEYKIQYRVYTPTGYNISKNLPVIYITDGQEYSDPQLGAVPTVLDNLIHLQKINPTIAVFVEPINPANEDENRRMVEMGMNEDFLSFFVDELIPTIESNYKVIPTKDNRVILGTSLGGLNAAYFAFSRPDIFGGAAIQAPAFWYKEGVYDLVRDAKDHPSSIYMSVGTIGDNTDDARLMNRLFKQEGIEFNYIEVNEGHSWGAWSAQVDEILLQFFSK